MDHPATGPISPQELQRIADLPFGAALRELRKHDPLFGIKPGEKINWRVEVSATARMTAYTTVEAENEAEATKMVEARDGNSFDWDCWDDPDFEVEGVVPA